MPKVEIDETELEALQRVNKFAAAALQNPKTREKMLRLQKELNPDAVIPELDARDSVLESVKAVEQRLNKVVETIETATNKQAEDRATAAAQKRIEDGEAMLRAKGYNDDGIKAITELMTAEGIASYGAALAYFERLHPPARPAEASASRFISGAEENIESADYKPLWESQGSSDAWLQSELAKSPLFQRH